MRIASLLIALTLVFAFALVPSRSMAQGPPKVINVTTYDVAGDMPKFLEFYKRAIALAEQYGSTGKSRLWVSTFAGPNTGSVAVATEYPSMASMAQSGEKLLFTPEWQKLVAEFEAANMRAISSSLAADFTP
jgi:hypothetical protein